MKYTVLSEKQHKSFSCLTQFLDEQHKLCLSTLQLKYVIQLAVYSNYQIVHPYLLQCHNENGTQPDFGASPHVMY